MAGLVGSVAASSPATAAPASWASTNPGTEAGAMPAKMSDGVRAT